MSTCESREARYVPWSFGEVFECLACRFRKRQDHRLQRLRGDDYEAVYPFPEHERRSLLCAPCASGFHDICSGRRYTRAVCDGCDCSRCGGEFAQTPVVASPTEPPAGPAPTDEPTEAEQ